MTKLIISVLWKRYVELEDVSDNLSAEDIHAHVSAVGPDVFIQDSRQMGIATALTNFWLAPDDWVSEENLNEVCAQELKSVADTFEAPIHEFIPGALH